MLTRIGITVTLLALIAGGSYYFFQQQGEPVCGICTRAVHAATHYRIFLRDQEPVDVCCPRCGLRFQEGRDDIAAVEAGDFDTGERLDAQDAFYVENSSVHLCCRQDFVRRDEAKQEYVLSWDRCLPSLVAFRTRQQAEAFRQRHGGAIKTYDRLLLENF